jgi:hypothetical protein
MIAKAIIKAAAQPKTTAASNTTLKGMGVSPGKKAPPAPATVPTKAAAQTDTSTIHVVNMSAEVIEAHFRKLVKEKFGGVEGFFAAAKGDKINIGRKDFKSALRLLGLGLTDAARKQLRKKIGGKHPAITLELLTQFVGEIHSKRTKEQLATNHNTRGGLADLPIEVPELPSAFKS